MFNMREKQLTGIIITQTSKKEENEQARTDEIRIQESST